MNTKEQHEKLKPCPFCGGTAIKQETEFQGQGEYSFWLRCSNCGAKSPRRCRPEDGELEALWNTRYEDPVMREWIVKWAVQLARERTCKKSQDGSFGVVKIGFYESPDEILERINKELEGK